MRDARDKDDLISAKPNTRYGGCTVYIILYYYKRLLYCAFTAIFSMARFSGLHTFCEDLSVLRTVLFLNNKYCIMTVLHYNFVTF